MKVEISRLFNGLTVIGDPVPQLESAAVGLWVNTGSRNEQKRVMGVSHMLEHMAFKGTRRRSARQIAEEIESVGGYLNAYTSREQTAFHARVLKADVPLALDILADILTSPTFDEIELERERQVVLQEIGQAHDTPDDIIFDHLQGVIYPGQPIGWPILGEAPTVTALARQDLIAYMEANYRAGSITLVASGAVEHAKIVEVAADKFSSLKPGLTPPPSPAQFEGGELKLVQDLEQAHIAFAFPGVSSRDDEYYAAQIYVTALGGGMSSRLFQEAREKRGLCYSIYAFAHSAKDGGVIGVYAGTGEAEAGELSAVVAGEMASMAENVTDEEVARARAQLKSSVLMGLERPGTRAEQIAGQMFALDRVLSVEQVVERLDSVDAGQIKSFAARLMATPSPAIAALGPVMKLEGHDTFARRFGASGALRAAE